MSIISCNSKLLNKSIVRHSLKQYIWIKIYQIMQKKRPEIRMKNWFEKMRDVFIQAYLNDFPLFYLDKVSKHSSSAEITQKKIRKQWKKALFFLLSVSEASTGNVVTILSNQSKLADYFKILLYIAILSRRGVQCKSLCVRTVP